VERAVGDYDQNGEVNIGDLTPLGQHFLQTLAPAERAVGWIPDGSYCDDGGGAGGPRLLAAARRDWRRARIDGDATAQHQRITHCRALARRSTAIAYRKR
jgi:hypothetical protein